MDWNVQSLINTKEYILFLIQNNGPSSVLSSTKMFCGFKVFPTQGRRENRGMKIDIRSYEPQEGICQEELLVGILAQFHNQNLAVMADRVLSHTLNLGKSHRPSCQVSCTKLLKAEMTLIKEFLEPFFDSLRLAPFNRNCENYFLFCIYIDKSEGLHSEESECLKSTNQDSDIWTSLFKFAFLICIKMDQSRTREETFSIKSSFLFVTVECNSSFHQRLYFWLQTILLNKVSSLSTPQSWEHCWH